jgi:hypothetical protein
VSEASVERLLGCIVNAGYPNLALRTFCASLISLGAKTPISLFHELSTVARELGYPDYLLGGRSSLPGVIAGFHGCYTAAEVTR